MKSSSCASYMYGGEGGGVVKILIKNSGRCCVHGKWYIIAPLLSELKQRPLSHLLHFVLILCLLYRISLFPCQLCLSVSLSLSLSPKGILQIHCCIHLLQFPALRS